VLFGFYKDFVVGEAAFAFGPLPGPGIMRRIAQVTAPRKTSDLDANVAERASGFFFVEQVGSPRQLTFSYHFLI